LVSVSNVSKVLAVKSVLFVLIPVPEFFYDGFDGKSEG